MYVEQNSKGIIGVNHVSIVPQGHLVPLPRGNHYYQSLVSFQGWSILTQVCRYLQFAMR